ncbi:MAG: hypothetical protein Q8L98_00735 [Chlamydiales bacterium]|nr:hypothetical protein [Chlamydiales bacterium]
MSLSIENTKLNKQYKELSGVKELKTWADQTNWERAERVYKVALPFIMMNKTLRFPLSLGLKTLSTASDMHLLITCLQDESDNQKVAYQTMQTTISIISLAGTIFSHPAGMLVTTGRDLIKNASQAKLQTEKKEYKEALESCARSLSNLLLIALFFHGGLPLSIALLNVQILLTMYNFQKEFDNERDLEAAGHLGMIAIRGQQIYEKLLQFRAQQQASVFA